MYLQVQKNKNKNKKKTREKIKPIDGIELGT